MNKSQAEKKAIEAQLRTLQFHAADADAQPFTIPYSEPSNSVSSRQTRSTTLESFPSSQPLPRQGATQRHPASASPSSPVHPPQASASVPRSAASPPHRPTPPSAQLPPLHNSLLQDATTRELGAADLAAIVDRLQQQSEIYLQQVKQLHPQSARTPEQYLDRALPVLEAQAQHINQLSAIQEAAILELKAIAEKVEQDWKLLDQTYEDIATAESSLPPLCDYLEAVVPQVEKDRNGLYVLKTRSIDLFKAEREAALTAQALRHWSERSQRSKSSSTSRPSFWQWLKHEFFSQPPESKDLLNEPDPVAPAPIPSVPPVRPSSYSPQPPMQPELSPAQPTRPRTAQAIRARRSRSRRSASSATTLRLKEGVMLVVSAVVVRVVLDLVLATFPVLWTPALAVLVTPAAIAVYRTNRTPRSGFVWGYRLLLIMIGLLLGGRL